MKPHRLVLVLLSITATGSLLAQTVFVPGTVTTISGSNMGIGSSSPQYKLDVAGQVSAHWTGDALLASGSGGWVGLYLQNDNYASGTYNRVATDSVGGLSINHNGNDLFYVGRSGTFDAWFAGGVDTNGQIRIRQKLFGGAAGLLIEGNSPTSNWPTLGFAMVNTTGHDVQMAAMETQIISNTAGNEAMDIMLYTAQGGSMKEAVRISSAGNVGIGTASPSVPLAIEPGSAAGPLANANDSNTYLAIGTWRTAGGHDYRIGIDGGTLWFGAWNNYRWYRTQTGGVDMVLNNGNLGIGTTNPTYPLTVNGTVRAKEVIVDTGWSDYVFDKNYKLPALSETEATIKSEKHLPGIPSAKEVAEHGISIGEMQAKLLAKIEELTLHQIEQEKRLAAQNAQLSAQSGQLAEQSARIERLEAENARLAAPSIKP